MIADMNSLHIILQESRKGELPLPSTYPQSRLEWKNG